YQTAGALEEDLRRWLKGEPILARPTGQVERLWRWSKRKPVVAGLIMSLAVVFLLGFIGVTWKWREAEREKNISQVAEQNEAAQRAIAVEQVDLSRRLLYASDMTLAYRAWEGGDIGRARDLLNRQWPQAGEDDLRGFEWRRLWQLCRDRSRQTLRGHTAAVTFATFSRDGNMLATSGSDHSVCIWHIVPQRRLKLVVHCRHAHDVL